MDRISGGRLDTPTHTHRQPRQSDRDSADFQGAAYTLLEEKTGVG